MHSFFEAGDGNRLGDTQRANVARVKGEDAPGGIAGRHFLSALHIERHLLGERFRLHNAVGI